MNQRIVQGRRASPLHALCSGLLLAGALGGCTLGPDFVRPLPPVTDRYTQALHLPDTVVAGGEQQRFLSGAAVPAGWWHLFRSETLDRAVQMALAHNPSVQVAQANLRQAQDLLRAARGAQQPQVAASAGISRARSASTAQGALAISRVYNLFTASGSVSYTLDVFGSQARTVEGLAAQVDVQAYQAQATFITLTANVVSACIARAAYSAELDATRQVLDLQEAQLATLGARVQAGTAAYASVLTQRSLIAATRTQLAPLQLKLAQAEHLLALLQGAMPAQPVLPDIALGSLTLPGDLPVGVPSDLVRQRPDILAAEANLHVASAAIGVATAARYPSFFLDAGFGSAGSSLSDLGTAGGRFWSIGPSLTAPLWNGGTLRARQQAATDAFDAQQAQYRQTVLTAFSQVADALQALAFDALSLQAQDAAQEAAANALTLIQASFHAGLSDWLELSNADTLYQQAHIGALQAQAQRHQDTVALFVALGGGWQAAP